MNEQIVILDFGSQYTQVIARRVRECKVYSTIVRYDMPADRTGGDEAQRDHPVRRTLERLRAGCAAAGPGCSSWAFRSWNLLRAAGAGAVPGGKVERGQKREYGKGTLTIRDSWCPLLLGLPGTLQVWNSHGDKLTKLPKGFKSVATTDNSDYAVIEDRARHFYGLQFHPEVVHTPRGREIISSFVHGICGAVGTGRCRITLTRRWKRSRRRWARST
jgi:GMP synthase (glutamine-hydrolysing)